MTNKVNQKTNKGKTRYIPMELTDETIKDFGIDREDVVWAKIGNKRVRVIMVLATEEQYLEYMRPEWREDKRRQRHGHEVSHNQLYEENRFEFADLSIDVENEVMKHEFIRDLHKLLAELEEKDQIIMKLFINGISETKIGRIIGMSQRGVGKRKQKIILKLREGLKDWS